jgi:hypothetical protein
VFSPKAPNSSLCWSDSRAQQAAASALATLGVAQNLGLRTRIELLEHDWLPIALVLVYFRVMRGPMRRRKK